MDDADGSKYSKKLGGMLNTAIEGGEDIYGGYDAQIGENNVEIRGSEIMQIDQK
jgi:hypothetical protein